MTTAAQDLVVEYPPIANVSVGDGFYEGDGNNLIGILLTQNWVFVWSKTSCHWCMMSSDDRSMIAYVEGDLYLGNPENQR